MSKKQTKVVMIGLDGGTWDLLKPWVDKDMLPNLKALMEKSVWGNLASTIPPTTIPAWVTIATGKNPGSHGSFNFMMPQESLLDAEPINSRYVKGETFYERLGKRGKKCVIINLPGAYPPKAKNCVFLPSFIDSNEQDIHPKEIIEDFPIVKKYKVFSNVSTIFKKDDSSINDIRKIAATRFKISRELFEKLDWNLFFVMFSASDWIQHRKYGYLKNGKNIKNSVSFKFYKEFDNYLGWFINNLPDKAYLMLLSDHGFGINKYLFYINKWLEKKDLLKTKKVFLKRRSNLPLGANMLMGALTGGSQHTPFAKFLSFLFNSPQFNFMLGETARVINRAIPARYRFIPKQVLNAGVELDIENSLACCIPGVSMGVYVNDKARFKDGVVEVEDYEDVRSEIIHGLNSLRTPQGEKVFLDIYKKEEIYKGGELKFAPDIIFQTEGVVPATELVGPSLFEKCNDDEGQHRSQGIFLLHGPRIKRGKRILGATLADLAPTIINLFGIKTAKQIEGRVLNNVFQGKNTSLEKKLKKSEEIIEKVLDSFDNRKTALAWTGGKDSTLLLWIVKEICQKKKISFPKIVFVDEGDPFEEVMKFAKEMTRKWRLKVDWVKNDDVLKQAKKIGDEVKIYKLGARNKKELKRLKFKGKTFKFEPESLVGNHLMKTVPLNQYLEKHKIEALITGIRRDEHLARAKENYFSPRENPKHMRIHPILEFTEKNVWQVILEFSIPYNPLYKGGYRSLGVKSTTERFSTKPAWKQDMDKSRERGGRRQDKEKIMERLRQLGYM